MSERYGEGIKAHVMRAEQTAKDQASQNDFGAMIDATIAEHSTPRVEALFLWPLVAWSVLALGAAGYALYMMSRS